MLKRCAEGATHHSGSYAERGIGISPDWLEYEPFKAWAEQSGYSDGLTIDRRNNDENYSPQNCHWVDRKAQARNRRNSRWITINGETRVLAEWIELTGITRRTFYNRLARGATEAQALFPNQ